MLLGIDILTEKYKKDFSILVILLVVNFNRF